MILKKLSFSLLLILISFFSIGQTATSVDSTNVATESEKVSSILVRLSEDLNLSDSQMSSLKPLILERIEAIRSIPENVDFNIWLDEINKQALIRMNLILNAEQFDIYLSNRIRLAKQRKEQGVSNFDIELDF